MANIKAIIRKLNDEFRRSLLDGTPCQYFITPMVAALHLQDQVNLLSLVKCFEDFNEDNDPYQEHDFGKVDYKGKSYFWKIDYYDKNDMTNMSEDPSNPDKTTRVITLMHASEY